MGPINFTYLVLSISENTVGAAAQSVIWAEIVEVRHAAGIVQRRRRVRPIEPPIIPGVAIESLSFAEVADAPGVRGLNGKPSDT
jgi:hypothetical protein